MGCLKILLVKSKKFKDMQKERQTAKGTQTEWFIGFHCASKTTKRFSINVTYNSFSTLIGKHYTRLGFLFSCCLYLHEVVAFRIANRKFAFIK